MAKILNMLLVEKEQGNMEHIAIQEEVEVEGLLVMGVMGGPQLKPMGLVERETWVVVEEDTVVMKEEKEPREKVVMEFVIFVGDKKYIN
jgi:hypothetical protein